MCVLGKVFFDVLMFQVYLLFKDHRFTSGVISGCFGLRGKHSYVIISFLFLGFKKYVEKYSTQWISTFIQSNLLSI